MPRTTALQRTWALLALALATALPAQKGDAPAVPPVLQAIQVEFEAARKEVTAATQTLMQSEEFKAAQAAKDSAKLAELRKQLPRLDTDSYAERALAAVATEPADHAVPLLAFALANASKAELGGRVLDRLQGEVKSPRLLALFDNLGALARVPADRAKAFLAAVQEQNPSKEVQAWAHYANARLLRPGRDASAAEKAAMAAEAEEHMAMAEKLGEGTAGHDRFAAPRFEKERLQVGMQVPDIEGEDVDGVPFKLSDYRGKVVVLDFWGFW